MSKIKQSMSHSDVKITNEKLIHDGFCCVKKYTLKQRCFSGRWSSDYTREVLIKPGVAAAIAYDPKLNVVVLVEQFRIGAVDKNNLPWLIEIVAGIMDDKDKNNYEDLIKREILEETGLEASKLLPIYEYFVSPGCSNEKVKLFCAIVDSTKAAQFCGLDTENEDIKVHILSIKDAFAAVKSGKINNSFTIIALQWLELNLHTLECYKQID